jgi:hypothetical protein
MSDNWASKSLVPTLDLDRLIGLIPFLRYIYIIFQRLKVIKKKHKNVEIKVFLHYLLVDGRILI